MKKFLLACVLVLAVLLAGQYIYYNFEIYIPRTDTEIAVNAKAEGKEILLKQDGEFRPFEIRGVDLGAGIPGKFATDFAIDKKTYLRWFRQIQDMGANTIRVYTTLGSAFYEAFYAFNRENPKPLYLLHGLWIDDYAQFSHMDAYDPAYKDTAIENGKDIIDILHGNKKLYFGSGSSSGSYNRDISPWVIGYILGVEWEETTVAFTNDMQRENTAYTGTYLSARPGASAFEALLAELGDRMITYETRRYSAQRLVAFSNWPQTDPFAYSDEVKMRFNKVERVDVEHIAQGEAFLSGCFASYHIYPYFPDFYSYYDSAAEMLDPSGRQNTYYAYLKALNDYHTIPVVISEFGIPTSRGMAQEEQGGGRNQGRMSEKEQGEALLRCYRNIMDAGCAGSLVFIWQDEWFKRTWNTMHAVDLYSTAYWSDAQTNEQMFGLLAFDPGKEQSVCYVDGDVSEWTEKDRVISNGGLELSVKYDEKFVYLRVYRPGLTAADALYIPIDVTPKSGALFCENYGLSFDRGADFVLAVDGEENSRLVVQERYETLRAMFLPVTQNENPYSNPPAPDTSVFKPIRLLLQEDEQRDAAADEFVPLRSYETGLLLRGNANPNSPEHNSIADYCYGTDNLEIRIPWQLLNFSNPSAGKIHDDYYVHYGVEELKIDALYFGVTEEALKENPVDFGRRALKPWYDRPTYHERLKDSYYMLQSAWSGRD